MLNRFNIDIPKSVNGSPIVSVPFEMEVGETLYILGANGSGKSSLITKLFRDNSLNAKRISAHRQTWFSSNALDMTPRARVDLENNVRSQDQQERSRYSQSYGEQRSGAAIFDLVDAENALARSIADLVRMDRFDDARLQGRTPAPIQLINEIMKLSNIPIAISIEDREKIVARRNGGPPYSIAELSDGERNAFLIAADVLTAPSGTLVLIDEPERHLHRSIISPLLTLLFSQRSDCSFIISTHEFLLPLDNSVAKTLLVRSCGYNGPTPIFWDYDILEPNSAIDEELKIEILGNRRKLLFIEGTHKSLDAPLYALLFPNVSIIPKLSCREVELSVRGLRGTSEMHWIRACGIVDNDRRTEMDIEKLRDSGIFSLEYYSVESLYFHPEIIRRVALRAAKLIGSNAETMFSSAVAHALSEAQSKRDHLILQSVEKLVRQAIFSKLPNKNEIRESEIISLEIDLIKIREEENSVFDRLIKQRALERLLHFYSLRETGALHKIAKELGFQSKQKYEAAVRTLLQEDPVALNFLRNLFSDLATELNG